MQACRVNIPTSIESQELIFKFSSPLTLRSGVRFRICSYCGCKLDHEKTELKEHLKLVHVKIWRRYISCLEKSIKSIYKKQKQRKAIPQLVKSSDEESEDDSVEDSLYNAVDCLNRSSRPALTVFEKKLRRTFTYDKQHFKEFSDYDVLAMCNNIKKSQIHKILGKDLGYENCLRPNSLYGKSRMVNKIARLLCEKGCYYLPGKCLLDDEHTFDYKELMRKDLHDKFHPEFKNLLAEDLERKVTLELNNRNHPKFYEMCQSIGYTKGLLYNSEGYLEKLSAVRCGMMKLLSLSCRRRKFLILSTILCQRASSG